MPTVTQVLDAALSEAGYTECPRDAQGRCIFTGHTGPGANHTKFAAEASHPNGQPWCDTFVVAIAHRTSLILPSYGAYTPTSAAAYQKAGKWHTTDPQPGDQVFYRFPGSARIDHTGFVVTVSGRTLHTMEGNTSSDNRGSQSSGGGAFPRWRNWDNSVVGFGRPDYSKPLPPVHPSKENPVTIYIPVDANGNDHDANGNPVGPQILVHCDWWTTLTSQQEADELVQAGAVVQHAKPFVIQIITSRTKYLAR